MKKKFAIALTIVWWIGAFPASAQRGPYIEEAVRARILAGQSPLGHELPRIGGIPGEQESDSRSP